MRHDAAAFAGRGSWRLVRALAGAAVAIAVVSGCWAPGGAAYGAGAEKVAASRLERPKKTQRPVVTGVLEDGQVLTAESPGWVGAEPITFAFRWERCTGKVCASIGGAESQSYRAQTADVGSKLRVVVTATNAVGHATATSARSAVVTAGPPVDLTSPTVSGTPLVGQALEASPGEWAGTPPLAFHYQWVSCNLLDECSDIAGATGASYTVEPLQVGSSFEVRVTASNSVGSASATSEPTSVASDVLPKNTELPSITGKLLDGQLLQAVVGGWTGTEPLSYTYEWLLCDAQGEQCASIEEAGTVALQLVSTDVGDTLRVAVTATNAGGSKTAVSEPTSIVSALLPKDTELPSIAGSLVDGQTLKALTGTWTGTTPISYSYQWHLCNESGGACSNITSAEAAILSLISTDVGKTLRVAVTATNAGGSMTTVSEPTSIVSALLPKNTDLPSISGSLLDGQTLKALTGTWTGSTPVSYSYQWELCNAHGEACAEVSEASSSTLALVSSFVGQTIRVAITASNAGGSQTAYSEPTSTIGALLPKNSELPSIAGSLVDGQTLKALTGTWTGTTPISYSYQWRLCNETGGACSNITSAEAAVLSLISTDVGKTLRVAVTATNAGGSMTTVSEPTSVVSALLPKNTELPSISGSLIDGQTLKALTGTWTGTTPISYTYEWEVCNAHGEACTEASEAAGSTLALVSSLVGKTVRVAITATNGGGSTTAYSEPTGTIAALLPKNSELPSITGALVDGQTLKASSGAWTGTTPISYSYQWRLCNASGAECSNITSAEAAVLSLISSDVGKTLRVAVTATNAGGSRSATSEATGPIAALLPSYTELPSITGSLVDGQALKASSGAWTGTTPISYSYQWRLCNASGAECSNITGAEAAVLSLISSDVGKTLRVVVTATNAGGSRSATSEATGLVAALLPSSTSAPTISGLLQVGQLLHASEGKWTGTTPITYSYQWQSCLLGTCSNISKAVESVLKLELTDVGLAFRVIVTATNAAGHASANSAITGILEGGL